MIESSGYGADKFTMVRNNDGTGSLKIVQSLDYEDQLQSNGFRFRIQVNDKVYIYILDFFNNFFMNLIKSRFIFFIFRERTTTTTNITLPIRGWW